MDDSRAGPLSGFWAKRNDLRMSLRVKEGWRGPSEVRRLANVPGEVYSPR